MTISLEYAATQGARFAGIGMSHVADSNIVGHHAAFSSNVSVAGSMNVVGALAGSISAASISSGVLAVARGGTGAAGSTGSASNVLSDSPALTGTATASNLSVSGALVCPNAAGLSNLSAANVTSGSLGVAHGGTGTATGLTALSAANVTSGVLAVARGGTGAATATSRAGSAVVLSEGPTITGNLVLAESVLQLRTTLSSNANQVQFVNSSNVTYTIQQVDHDNADYLRIGRNGAGDIVVAGASGNVGVGGKAVPLHALDVEGAVNASAGLLMGGAPVGRVVGSINELRLVRGSAQTAAHVRVAGYFQAGDGGGGTYRSDAGDGASVDDGGATVVASDGFRWKLVHDGSVSVCQFGAVGSGADESARVQAALDWAMAQARVGEGPRAVVTAPVNMPITVGAPIFINVPIRVRFGSFLMSTVAAGPTLIVGRDQPTRGNTNYDIRLAGIRSLVGASQVPTTVQSDGGVGIEVRNMQFSRMQVDTVVGFTRYGVYLNSTNDAYAQQHIQDNDMWFGIIGYCGIGVIAKSTGAEAGAVQVNRIQVQNTVSNYQHFILGDPAGTDNNTNDNDINIIAMEEMSGDTIEAKQRNGMEVYGLYNRVRITYMGCGIACAGLADANVVDVGNPMVKMTDHTDATRNNIMRCAHPNPSVLPAALAVTSDTLFTNTYGVPVAVYLSVTLSPTASGNCNAQLYYGKSAGSLFPLNACNAAAGQGSITLPMTLVVQPLYSWKVVATGSGATSFSAARCVSFGA